MAYLRKPRAYRRKPRYTRKRGSRSAPRSRFTAKTRRYTRKRPMSKRRILNTTSTKKRNGMLSWSNTTSSAANRPLAQGPAYINNRGGFFVYSPTAMTLDGHSTVANQSSRTASTCYMKGLSEHLRIETSSGIPWFHRRICFTQKGSSPFNTISPSDTPSQAYTPYLETSSGIERPWLDVTLNGMQVTLTAMWSLLFKGQNGKDWDNLMTAPVDTTRLTLKFDKTWTMQSGNANGLVRSRKLWHPMGHNLVYDDDESGDVQAPSYFSTDSKAGMGDYYIVDIIQPGTGATATDYLQIGANSTMYWHEK
uniref:Capsid protein n=1 Tax=Plant associated genomovirus 9 TaxID=2584403 RepID=A0A4Y5QCH5_9VIRU|nr:capsid protein [Plant associated genomovirus 9]QCX29434.1 capsid protein [Plant associated genomovirus 9]QCX29440.1 capsid protein [Plant associated genomovirus 9]